MRVGSITERKLVKGGAALGAWSLIGEFGAPAVLRRGRSRSAMSVRRRDRSQASATQFVNILGGINDKLKGGLSLGCRQPVGGMAN